MRKLMIADSSEYYTDALEAALGKEFHIVSCCDGEDVLDLLQSFRPDILVINLSLPHKDGLTLLQESAFRPSVILTIAGYVSHYIERSLVHLGVDYIMICPTVSSLCLRIRDLASRFNQHPNSAEPHTVTAHHLRQLGFPVRRAGYRYLLAAIPLYAENPNQYLTKELYPKVAKRCNGKDNRAVEHAMRTVIDYAWSHRDNTIWRKYFTPGPRGTIPCPSNKEFISRLAELVDTEIL